MRATVQTPAFLRTALYGSFLCRLWPHRASGFDGSVWADVCEVDLNNRRNITCVDAIFDQIVKVFLRDDLDRTTLNGVPCRTIGKDDDCLEVHGVSP